MNEFLDSSRPLIFLTVQSVKNGVVRAVTNIRRLIGLIFFIGYYLFVFIRPFDRSPSPSIPVPGQGPLKLPPPSVLEPWIFLIFAGLSLLLSISLPAYKSTFRPADVDVLFATPVSPRIVMLWRLARDYALTLLFPLFFVIIGWRGSTAGIQALFANFPQYGNYVLRALSGSWLLLALAWTCMGYAVSLFINRSDQESNRNRLWIYVFAYAPPALALATFVIQLRLNFSLATATATLVSPWLKTLFLPATAATEIVMAPLTGNLLLAVGGGTALILLITASMRIAFGQAGWMYDQAAARGFDAVEIRNLARRGDRTGIAAMRAKSGQIRSRGLSARIARQTITGPAATLWREAILQVRSGIGSNVFFALTMTVTVGGIVWASRGSARTGPIIGYIFLGSQVFSMLLMGLSLTQQGFVETLRRVDVLKPLPFTPTKTVFYEIVGKSVLNPVISGFFSLALIPIAPRLTPEILANFLFLPTVSILVSSATFLVTILFPDIDDPTQRGFRSLMSMLAIVITVAPGLLLAAGIIALHASVFIAAIIGGLVNLGIAIGVAAIAGGLYAHYNPSE